MECTFLEARPWLLLLLMAWLQLGAGPIGPGVEDERPAPTIHVDVAPGSLTVDARDAPLSDVLRAIGDQAHVKVRVRGRLDTRVTRSFVASSFEDAIRRLIRGASTVWTYAPSPDARGTYRATEVLVIEPAERARTGQIRPEERAARLRAISLLSRRRDAASESELTRLSQDADAVVRAAALAALARRGSTR
jgi:hypothetical protein